MLRLINTKTKPSRESAAFKHVINLLFSCNFHLFMHSRLVAFPSLCVKRHNNNINNYNWIGMHMKVPLWGQKNPPPPVWELCMGLKLDIFLALTLVCMCAPTSLESLGTSLMLRRQRSWTFIHKKSGPDGSFIKEFTYDYKHKWNPLIKNPSWLCKYYLIDHNIMFDNSSEVPCPLFQIAFITGEGQEHPRQLWRQFTMVGRVFHK